MAVLVFTLAWGVAACDSVRQASDNVIQATDQASICAEALRLAGFTPDVSNPEKAAQEAQRTSEDLSKLAEQAPDATLREALTDLSNQMGQLRPAELDPASVATWAQEKVVMVNTLSRACSS